MKHFEKWKHENCDIKGCPHKTSCNCCETIWREAVGWVLAELEIEESYEVFCARIKDELGEE